ncbi:MAG: ribonuclease HIII [Bacilli bacterium]|nr:ribonuclease HIII [Bacilli bacterium]
MADITLKLTLAQVKHLQEQYASMAVEVTHQYALFRAKVDDVEITIYQNSKHDYYKTVFRGLHPEKIAQAYSDTPLTVPQPKQTKTPRSYLDKGEQIGSDEVGFGDFFGPLVVAASYVDPQQLSELELLGVTDSKKIDDERIRKIGPLLIHHFVGIYYTVDNPKFNQLIKDGYNMNKMKAMLHNQALQRLRSKKPGTYPAYIDQFCTPEKFAAYLNVKMIENVHFATKAESLYPSVALASVIARYVFLVKMDELGAQYHVTFPLGAGKHVDEFAQAFKEKHGLEALNAVCKMNFKNYQRVINENL